MKLKSPLGEQNIGQNHPKPQKFTVEDASSPNVTEHYNNMEGQEFFAIPEDAQVHPGWDLQQAPPQQPQRPQTSQQPPTAPPQRHVMKGADALKYRDQLIERARASVQENPQLKQQVNAVLGIGRGYDVAVIGECEFKLRTLKGLEREYLANLINEFATNKNPANMYKIRHYTLALSIYEVNYTDIDMFLGVYGTEANIRLGARVSFIEELDSDVSTFLYDKFEKMSADHAAGLSLGTKEEVEEVANAVRKSGSDE